MQQVATGSTRSYELLYQVAEGGMAELFLARTRNELGLDRHCVVKRIRADRRNDIHFIAMFRTEARITASLSHPNTPLLLDCGELDSSPFIALEYIHGATLRDILHRTHASGTSIPLRVVLAIIAGCAAGLHHAHERRVVHGDISPSNLMVGYEGTVKVVDFGVARIDEHAQVRESISGKYGYMSPEQCRRRRLDRRSDLFSLGIVMWELLTGRRLFDAANLAQMVALTAKPVPVPSTVRPELSPEIDAIVARLLALDPADRFATADELACAIEDAMCGVTLSPAGLSRFMTDLFGETREPRHDAAGAVTSTLTIAEPPTVAQRPNRSAGSKE